jgi:hypothetical protein
MSSNRILIDSHWYNREHSGLTHHQAIDMAAAWKRNQRRWADGRRISGRRFYARAVKQGSTYSVFVRTGS